METKLQNKMKTPQINDKVKKKTLNTLEILLDKEKTKTITPYRSKKRDKVK